MARDLDVARRARISDVVECTRHGRVRSANTVLLRRKLSSEDVAAWESTFGEAWHWLPIRVKGTSSLQKPSAALGMNGPRFHSCASPLDATSVELTSTARAILWSIGRPFTPWHLQLLLNEWKRKFAPVSSTTRPSMVQLKSEGKKCDVQLLLTGATRRRACQALAASIMTSLGAECEAELSADVPFAPATSGSKICMSWTCLQTRSVRGGHGKRKGSPICA